MPDPKHSTGVDNAFHPRSLKKLDENEEPATGYEAANGGFWRIVPLADDKFGLFRLWESPERGDEPFAVLTDRPLALLAAAFLPLVARARTLYTLAKRWAACGRPMRSSWKS